MGLGVLNNGLANTPPMGWNSWNKFACQVDERLIKETAEAMVSSGMCDAGYQYVVIDDCWSRRFRGRHGNLRASTKNFPLGIPALADYIHSLGLKFGIYTCAGIKTCQGYPGSYKKADRDAQLFADWGVDYVKVDWCYTRKPFVRSVLDPRVAYGEWRDAILKTGRPIVLSICEWGGSKPWEWAGDVGHLWRTTGDIGDKWIASVSNKHIFGLGVIDIIDRNADLWSYAGPGHWNDPDMLEVGNGGMTFEEYKTHFSLWCMMAAPLMTGNDLRNMSEDTRKILTAKEVVAINQDPFGQQGRRVLTTQNGIEIWKKDLRPIVPEGDVSLQNVAVAFFNRSDVSQSIRFDPASLRIYYPRMRIHNLWEPALVDERESHYGFWDKTMQIAVDNIPPHGTVILRLEELWWDPIGWNWG
ncbi:MAG: hypothetical protein A3A80_00530 [Candidatus Terrybacteria bacterium RIFCSPLOWO2_01_FULL_44_24]|uniref:Alpha-galactosidase n=1 Tax=Candidatus Terrybacteria bacterium RIFCSPHIGHO2_01_FULL_43_35 TaxID=1802361 RepID=A0A1G2PEZ8_9BACT|nr:MAG: hypothetical protein A2828_01510 [Candidatus Terrybacteria bacterium RIFCSPHIGHO2_01_FULL_43_35]OHA50328.1 MAG: hypothetical protein A3B75_02240 [Candidatus Terrybacteria bacterium RIFCSPHIGHO2_02_FULL_43_14]OHA51416.1 MAG: hypothetical protein A3A80_00530 [Candidatus Terrybacteria bacterium RIFCSPLOWO2_01_FULL_44_24]